MDEEEVISTAFSKMSSKAMAYCLFSVSVHRSCNIDVFVVTYFIHISSCNISNKHVDFGDVLINHKYRLIIFCTFSAKF